MKAEHARRLASPPTLGGAALTLTAAGYSGSVGSPPAAYAGTRTAHARSAVASAHSGQKLYVSLTGAARVQVYSTGSSPTLLQTITAGTSRPGGLWVDDRNVLYVVNVPAGRTKPAFPSIRRGH